MNVAAKRNKGALRGPGRKKEAKLIRHGCEEQSGIGVMLARSKRRKQYAFQAWIDLPIPSSQVTNMCIGGTQDLHLLKTFKDQPPQG